MKIQKILTSIIAAAAIVCSCEKAPEGGTDMPSNIKSDLTFTLSITEISYNYVQLSVKHNGTTNDTWYGFLTDQPSGKDAALVASKIAELKVNGEIKGLEKRTSKRVEFNDLEAATKYRYIAFAITPDGQLYGEMAILDIETPEGFLLKKVEDWSVAYEGRNAGTNMETYSVVFNKNGAARCHVGFIPKWMVEYYEALPEIQEEIAGHGGLRIDIGEQTFLFTVLDYLVFEELYEFWGYYDEDSNYFNQETFSSSSTFELPRQESGEYYAVAIGFDNSYPTFTYSADLVTVVKETASENYNSWIGNWTLTGANNISYNLKFEENDPNYSYYVYGWECSESIHNTSCTEGCTEHTLYTDFTEYGLGIPFYFDALTGEMTISSMMLGGDVVASGAYMYWGMFGYTEYAGETVCILTQEDKIASAALATGSQTTLNGLESVTYKYGSDNTTIEEVKFTYSSLGYVQYDEKSYTPVPWNLPIELPAVMVKADESTPVVSSKNASRRSIRKANAASSYKNIKKADYSKLIKADFLNK